MIRWSQFATDVGSTLPAIVDAISKATGKKIEYEGRSFPAFVAPEEFMTLAASPTDKDALKTKKKAFAANKTAFKADWVSAPIHLAQPSQAFFVPTQPVPSPMPHSDFHPFAGWIAYLEYYKQWQAAYIDFQIESLKKVEEQWSDALQASLAPLSMPVIPFKDLFPSPLPNPFVPPFLNPDLKVKDLLFPFAPKSGKKAHATEHLVATKELSSADAKRIQAQAAQERANLKNATLL